jgi:hypothetical protein
MKKAAIIIMTLVITSSTTFANSVDIISYKKIQERSSGSQNFVSNLK